MLVVVGVLTTASLIAATGSRQGRTPPAATTQSTSAPVERFVGATVHRRGTTLVVVPAHRNGRLAVYVHGASQTGADAVTNATTSTITAGLLRAGYVVAAANAGGNAWGDAASVRSYSRLIEQTERRYALGRVYLYAESMGALAGAQLAEAAEVRAWVGIFPVCDVSTLRQPDILGQIAVAYPLGAPRRLSPVAWPHKPVMVWASSGDAVVPASTNGARCAASVGGRFTATTGDHGDASNYDPAAVVAFFDEH